MTRVLLVAVKKPSMDVLNSAIEYFAGSGVDVSIAASIQAVRVMGQGQNVHVVKERAAPLPSRVRRRPDVRRSQRYWQDMRFDPWVERHARRADVIVALDAPAVYAVWELAQRHPHANAQFGLAPARRAVESLSTEADRSSAQTGRGIEWRAWLFAARYAWSRSVEHFWESATSPGLLTSRIRGRLWMTAILVRLPAQDVHLANIGYRAARSLVTVRENRKAAQLVDAFAHRIRDNELAAELREAVVRDSIARGRVPAGLTPAVTAVLSVADEELADGDLERAGELAALAAGMMFNVPLNFHRGSSALAANPAKFLQPLHDSKIGAALSAPAGRERAALPAPADRPLRLFVTTATNANFLSEILAHFEQRTDVEVRFFDVFSDPELKETFRVSNFVAEKLGSTPEAVALVESRLRPHLDWADVVFIDWASRGATMYTLIDPGTTRIVVRLHSFEAFTMLPHLIDYSRVDDFIFVSRHLQAFANEVLPELSQQPSVTQWVIPNAMKLKRFAKPKSDDARFTVALIGYSQIAKDALWALRVVELLRENDPRYRLLLVGTPHADRSSAWARSYTRKLESGIARLKESGAVEVFGQTDDIPGVLTRVGVILSSSVRESFHVALAEGAASGAVPVVRNWPYFALHEHGAKSVFPPAWVVDNPEEAVSRILSTTCDDKTWRESGDAAKRLVLENYDWEVVEHLYDNLVGHEGSAP